MGQVHQNSLALIPSLSSLSVSLARIVAGNLLAVALDHLCQVMIVVVDGGGHTRVIVVMFVIPLVLFFVGAQVTYGTAVCGRFPSILLFIVFTDGISFLSIRLARSPLRPPTLGLFLLSIFFGLACHRGVGTKNLPLNDLVESNTFPERKR